MILRRVMVTGASGFIGKHVVQHFISQGVDVVEWNRDESGDLSNWNYVSRGVKDIAPDAIIHLAANPIVKFDEKAPPAWLINDNILSTQNLLVAAPENCIFVNASSATVYGECVSHRADVREEKDPPVPNSVYGATKLASEALVCAHTAIGRVRGVNLRLVANVGAGATHGVVKDLIEKLRSSNPNLELLGEYPGSTKPFIHVDDTAKAFFLAANDKRWDCQPLRAAVNISSKTTISVEQLAFIIMDEINISKPLVWLGEKANWKGDNRRVHVSNNIAMGLGWNPKYPDSESAVRRAVKDILELQSA